MGDPLVCVALLHIYVPSALEGLPGRLGARYPSDAGGRRSLETSQSSIRGRVHLRRV